MEDLKHPNIICMFDSFETDDEDGARFVLMEILSRIYFQKFPSSYTLKEQNRS